MKGRLDEPIAAPERRSRSPEQCLVDEPTLEPDRAAPPERTVQLPVQKLEQSPVLARRVLRTQPSIQPVLDGRTRRMNHPRNLQTIRLNCLRMTRPSYRRMTHLNCRRLNHRSPG